MHNLNTGKLAEKTKNRFTLFMDVFVTGGTGTIGRALVQQLLARGHRVIGLTRSKQSASKLRQLGANANAFPGDLTDPVGWVERAVTCDAVVHTGATFEAGMARTDMQAMQALKAAARTRKNPLRLLYTGGIWLYPEATRRPLTETVSFAPLPAFTWMKEQIRSLQTDPHLSVAILHPALVCTPTSGPIAEIANAIRENRAFETRATEDTFWPLVSADDLARLYGAVLEARSFRLSLLAAAIPGIRVGDLGQKIADHLNGTFTLKTVSPAADIDPRQDFAAGYGLSQIASSRRAASLKGWSPTCASVESLIETLLQGPQEGGMDTVTAQTA